MEMTQQLDMMNDLLEAIRLDDKLLPGIAMLMYKLFRELQNVGFTEDQAIRIVANYKLATL